MTAKETIKTRLDRLRQQSRETGQVRLSASAVTLGAEAAIHFLLSAVLAGISLPGGEAPFGTALTAAAGSGICGAAAALGACLGSLCLLGFSQGMRHGAAAILIFAVAFAFYDLKVLRRAWAMPAVAALLSFFTGSVLLARTGWTGDAIFSLTAEALLTAACAWCYRGVLLPMRTHREDRLLSPVRRAGLLVLLSTLLMALAPLSLFGPVTAGGCLAALGALAAAWQGGAAAGAVAGVAMGGALDLAAGGPALYAFSLGMAGAVSGLARGKNRLLFTPVFVLAGGAAVLLCWQGGRPAAVLGETLLASLLFPLLPQRPLRKLGAWLAPEAAGPADLRAQQLVRKKLEASARAFRTLGDALHSAFQPPRNDSDVSTVFERAAGLVCRNCSLRGRCWKQDYTTTFNALNDATAAMLERGRAEAADFPRHFSDRCLHFPAFLAAVNQELTALLYRRQYNARVQESRSAVCRQYLQLSELLGSAAAELSRELVPDPLGERKLRARLAELGLEVRVAVFRDSRGLLRVEAEGPGCPALARPGRAAELSRLLGAPLRVEEEGPDALSLLQQEPLMAVAGVAARKKTGETVSGDAGTYFKRPDGKLYVLLCDGMGSGPEANRESSLAVRLLEQFLQAGVEPCQALTTLSSALALRGEDTGGFTTVDLLQVDLFTGESELLKMGAAPTYVKKGGVVQRFAGVSLPAGLAAGGTPQADQFSLRLAPGDCVLMVSDGVCGAEDDRWVRELLASFRGDSPKELARDLITRAPQEATDDRTALVVRLEWRI